MSQYTTDKLKISKTLVRIFSKLTPGWLMCSSTARSSNKYRAPHLWLVTGLNLNNINPLGLLHLLKTNWYISVIFCGNLKSSHHGTLAKTTKYFWIFYSPILRRKTGCNQEPNEWDPGTLCLLSHHQAPNYFLSNISSKLRMSGMSKSVRRTRAYLSTCGVSAGSGGNEMLCLV